MSFVIFIASLILSLVFMKSRINNVVTTELITEPLTKDEKITVWVLCLLSPIVAGAIFYYGWKTKLPKKAAEANIITWCAVGIFLFAGTILALIKHFLIH